MAYPPNNGASWTCLTERRPETRQSWLAWMRQMPEAAKPMAMLGLIERLKTVRLSGIEAARGHRVHQARLAQLVREANRTTVQNLAGFERQRRHAGLVALSLDLAADLTDKAIDLFDRLIGTMFRKAEARHARDFQADGRAINEGKQNAFDAITKVLPWERFCSTVTEAEALTRPDEFDAYQMLGEHYAGIRRWAPAFFETFTFQSTPAAAALMRGIKALRDMNRMATPSLPKSAPTSFVRQRWARHVLLPGGVIDRPYYELCVLSELRDRLRAGDVWVMGSRRFRAFEERLISRETLRELQQNGDLPIAVGEFYRRAPRLPG
jgi:hypothetical protein